MECFQRLTLGRLIKVIFLSVGLLELSTKGVLSEDSLPTSDPILKARELFKSERYSEVVCMLRELSPESANRGDVEAFLEKATRYLAIENIVSAQQFQQEDLPGNALLRHLFAAGYEESNPFSRQGVRTCVEALRAKSRYRVGFAGFHSREASEAAGQLDTAARTSLSTFKSSQVTILDRAALREALPESSTIADRFPTTNGDVKLDQKNGVDALLIGDIEVCRTATSRSETDRGQTRYVRGIQMVENPQYDQALREVQIARGQLENARRSLGTTQNLGSMFDMITPNANNSQLLGLGRALNNMTGNNQGQEVANAEARLASAQATLSGTPRLLQRDNWVTDTYPIYTVTANAEFEGTVKLVDSSTSRVLTVERFKGTDTAKSRYVEGDSRRNIEAIPIQLPDDATMRRRAVGNSLSELDAIIQKTLRNHGKRFMVLRDAARVEGNSVKAVEYAVCYLFAYPDGRPEFTPLLEELEQALKPESKLVAFRKLLRQHCGIAAPTNE